MDLHLFSSPGERGIENILAVSRPYLANRSNPTIVYDMNVCATDNFSALNLLPYTFNVHYPARERARVKRDEWLQDYHRFHPHPILALEDGAYLRVQAGEMVTMRGNCWLFAKEGEGRQRFEHAVFPGAS